MTGIYDQICNMFIKPARQTYSDYDLGPISFGKHGIRQNFSFDSHKGYELKASFFKNKNNHCSTCIIYLHSFNGSRLQSLRYATQIVQKGFHFCSFDFAGCGNSEGQYVSLGCNQKWDVIRLIELLKEKYGLTQYFIWGRSMGAVTAIKFYSLLLEKQQTVNKYTDISILGLVLDSAFISLKRMVIQVGKNRLSIPQFIIKAALLMIRSSIEQKAQFKFDDLQLHKEIECIRCSTLLIASKQDTFVPYLHSQQVFSKLKLHDNKQIQYTRGEHYQSRDQKTVNSIYSFIQKKYRRYNILLTKVGCLKESRTNGISRVKDFSIEKNSKSLRKYQPKIQRQQNTLKQKHIKNKINTLSNNFILIQSIEEEQSRFMQSTQMNIVGSEKKIPQKSCELLHKQYQTQKKIAQPKIKFVISSSKELTSKNQLQNKIKPTLLFNSPKIQKKNEDILQQQLHKSTQRTLQLDNQENHCNIITHKLRKKGKPQRQKNVQISNEIIHSFTLKEQQQKQKPKAKIKFIMNSQVSTPNRAHQNDKSTKKPSMTAQQYKNSQINLIKGIVTLSPKIKKRQQKTSCTDLKMKISESAKGFEQSKSMNNLISLGHHRANTNSFKKLTLMVSMQVHQQSLK